MATFEELRRKYPQYTDAEIRSAVDLLNTPPASREKIWEGEDQRGDPQPIGPDGLTERQRELNRFADENALPLPFPLRVRKP